ncbi:carboxypeptidase-like regulatory domain-containing protein [Bernardetia sp. ABR2-2B]|uniref:carboxypeptidase-like regulatory domain-containing protein n=1 Tax=Bernardetia sp. ABR2-2B TaxID=3127472 RepID=UPI0030CEBACD
MQRKTTISINKPCSENFDNFKATKAGGFCGSCQKEVIDFTQMSDKEIIAYFQNNQKKSCGRFNESQLKTYSTVTPSKRTYSLRKIGIGLMSFSLLSLLSINKSQAQQANPTIITETSEKQEKSSEDKNLTGRINQFTITGNITSPDGALPGAVIYIKGTKRGTQTDIDGNFSFVIPDGEVVLVFSYVGFKSKEIEITENTPRHLTVLLESSCELLGEVSVNEVYQSKQTVWQKFKGLFR